MESQDDASYEHSAEYGNLMNASCVKSNTYANTPTHFNDNIISHLFKHEIWCADAMSSAHLIILYTLSYSRIRHIILTTHRRTILQYAILNLKLLA